MGLGVGVGCRAGLQSGGNMSVILARSCLLLLFLLIAFLFARRRASVVFIFHFVVGNDLISFPLSSGLRGSRRRRGEGVRVDDKAGSLDWAIRGTSTGSADMRLLLIVTVIIVLVVVTIVAIAFVIAGRSHFLLLAFRGNAQIG